MPRPDWDEYFMGFARHASTRSTCMREGRQFGAVLVRDRRVITTGYNGAPRGIDHCEDEGRCLRDELNIPSGTRLDECMAVHAEQNAIIQAAYHGISTKGTTMYATGRPCSICAKAIINAGIVRVVFEDEYPNDLGRQLLEVAGVELVRLEGKDAVHVD